MLIYEDFLRTIDVIEMSHMCNCSKVVVELQKILGNEFWWYHTKNMIVIDNLFITCCFDSCIDYV